MKKYGIVFVALWFAIGAMGMELSAEEKKASESPAATADSGQDAEKTDVKLNEKLDEKTDEKTDVKDSVTPLNWEADFGQAVEKAKTEKKALLILVTLLETASQTDQMAAWLEEPKNRAILDEAYVCIQLDGTTEIEYQDSKAPVLKHAAFREMGHKAGIAVIDFRNESYLGQTVGAFPLLKGWIRYTPQHIRHILDLPAGTLTQRMLTFAVRIHPHRPQSANGVPSTSLMKLASGHARNQAVTYNMGHQNFSYRSGQVMRVFPGSHSSEICAQAGGGVALAGALSIVQLWRNSSGHWPAMRSSSRGWGYDMQRARNGNWYGCGLFAK